MTRPTRSAVSPPRALLGLALAVLAAAAPAAAGNTCISYTPGHVYYVAYQYSPSGPEYVVDLGDQSVFTSATSNVSVPNVSSGDFSSIFSGIAPNLFVGLFGVQSPATRDAIVSANGPKDDTQLNISSIVGAAIQIDSWATGLGSLTSPIGTPPACSPSAGTFPGNVTGSYQNTLNGTAQGSLGGNVSWNVETRLSNSGGTRLGPTKIHFDNAVNNPSTGSKSRGFTGMFTLYTNGTMLYQPDRDGDFLPDVPAGVDPNADLCVGVNSTNNTDADNDVHAAPCDCNDADAVNWATPAEAATIQFGDHNNLSWTPPADFGTAAAPAYDLIRGTQSAVGIAPTFACLQSAIGTAAAADTDTPALGGSPFFYLVRGVNGCPGGLGDGPVGSGRTNTGTTIVRTVPTCP
jgi:hypothetical protein